jgi:hypothetical protein
MVISRLQCISGIFLELTARGNLYLEQIYNADRTGVFWKGLPTKTSKFWSRREGTWPQIK